ncbi:butyrophilin, subfamily 1, member precursor [Sus scrofa]|uniref:butyrophilin, subfamily 1, member precursor n=1 Tax=Sus scrofa TaxID=9823 RepID=UPI00022AEF87|nr:butyrophilin, subfamily 1, member precursor [Sus scrofa]
MVCSWDFSLPRGLFFILLLQVSMWGSDSFLVIGPSEPIVAMLGGDTVLPCSVSPAMNLETMELWWFRSKPSEPVYVYRDGVEQPGEQMVDFKGRAELLKDYINEGKVAVRIHNLRVSDNGMYKCFFKKGSYYEEASLELKVIGLGSGPHTFMVGPEDEGIRLKCTGKGWFLQPEVQWKDARGEKIPSLSEDETQDDDGLFQIEASVIVRDSSQSEVSCSMKNPFFGQEQVETIFIPEPFFPRTSPWKVAFLVTFLILGIFVGAVVYLAWKEQQERKKLSKAQKEKEEEMNAKVSFEKELARRKELYQQDWRKAEIYADWRKEQFKAMAVTLDPNTAHRNLSLSENGKSFTENVPPNGDTPALQDQGASEDILNVLGQECPSAGRHYWEVEVKAKTDDGSGTKWALGVCSKTAWRKGWFVESPEKKFWVVMYKEGKVSVPASHKESLSLRQLPRRIGIFLDWDAKQVSFYNMIDGSHIHSFTRIPVHEPLYPYFSLRGAGTSLTICLDSDHTETRPDSSPKPLVTHSNRCDLSVPQEALSLLPP